MCIKNRLRLVIYTTLQMLKMITMTRDPTPKCPFDESHTVYLDPDDGHYYCKEHSSANRHLGKYINRIDELKRQWLIGNRLEYKEKTQEVGGRSTITNEELVHYFNQFKNKSVRIDVLKEVLGPQGDSEKPLLGVNDSNPSTSVIPSSYMKRLSRHTRSRWRQRRLTGEDGTPCLMIWIDGHYSPEIEKMEREERKAQREEKKEQEDLAKAHIQFRKDNKHLFQEAEDDD